MEKLKAKHKIRKQILEFEFPNEINKSQFQEQLSQLFRKRFKPAMEKVFNEISSAEQIHRIENLTLNLGEIDISNFENFNTDYFETSLWKELRNKISYFKTPSSQNSRSPETLVEGAIDKSRSTSTTISKEQAKAKGALADTNKSIDSIWELFSQFIEIGSLPWWCDTSDPELLKNTFLYLIQHQPIQLKTKIAYWLKYKSIRKRIITQLEEEQLFLLIGLFLPDTINNELKKLKNTHKEKNWFWWDTLVDNLKSLSNDQGKNSDSGFSIEHFEKKLSEKWVNKTEKTTFNVHNSIIKEGKKIIQDKNITYSNPSNYDAEEADKTSKVQLSENRHTTKQSEESLKEKKNIEEIFSSSYNIKEYYLSNSGLVVLWPYYVRFFKQLGLLKEQSFKSTEEQHRAASLLQGLATGQNKSLEFMLPLNKLLCGIPVNNPLEPMDNLSNEELTDCETLLRAVIEQIPILNNISVDGFRGSFLLREGILKPQPGQWQLYVERETFDVVLDRFPWPFNIVKLPWMEQLLYIEW